MPIALEELTAEIEQRLAALGFELVDLRKGGSTRRIRLQLRVDWMDAEPGRKVTIDDCATVSRHLEAWLDASGVLGDRYVLEVSSPGMERPVRRLRHWMRFVGRSVHVRLPDRGRITAAITQVDPAAGTVTLTLSDGEVLSVPVTDARDATLVVDWDAALRQTHGGSEDGTT